MDTEAPPRPGRDSALFLDFDGTLVDVAPQPDAIHVEPQVPRVLTRVNAALGGAVAVLSGRALADLDHHLRPLKLCAAGVHGAEWRRPDGHVVRLVPQGLGEARALLEALCARFPALRLEPKPGALALHYRQAPALEDECLNVMGQALALTEQMTLLRGKMVIELKPRHADKGSAMRCFLDAAPFRHRRPWFVGDDTTDEAGFSVAQAAGGVAIKVGEGPTHAAYRLANPHAVREWLAQVAADVRPTWAARGPSAGPLPGRPAIPSGDRPTYPSDEGPVT